jgi:hypothetical protein
VVVGWEGRIGIVVGRARKGERAVDCPILWQLLILVEMVKGGLRDMRVERDWVARRGVGLRWVK